MYLGHGYDVTEDRSKPNYRRRKKEVYKSVRNAMEFYLSDANLSKKRFFSQLIEQDPYIPLEVFLKCNKVISLVSTVEEIAKAVRKSDFLELSDDCLKVRRKTEYKVKENEVECTIYVENLPPEINHDELTDVFSKFGKVVYVSIPKYPNTKVNKGFAFVEFDTAEDAAETIRVFMEKGSSLSPHMLPEKLCSISTSDEPVHQNKLKNEEKTDAISDGPNIPAHSEKECTKDMKEEQCSEQSSKKRKVDSQDKKNETEPVRKQGKKSENDSFNRVDVENKKSLSDSKVLAKDKKISTEASENEGCQEDKEEEATEEKQKKKNRKNKKRRKDPELFANGMVVLSKQEWMRLKSKYQNMQRENMRRVKQQVVEARFMRRPHYMAHPGLDHWRDEEMRPPPPPVDAPKPRVTFTPGVIVCITFKEPMVDVKAFKAEARTQPGVQYVDVREGAMDAYLRCSAPQDAQHLLQLKFWKGMSILSGSDESDYWDKIAKDREEKLTKNIRVNKEKGKKKLLKKAEIIKATHLHFDN